MMAENGLETLKVLIVEDQAEVRTMLRAMLTEIGINHAFESQDGRQALEFIDSDFDPVDVVICDWNMPRMSGMDLLKQIRTVDQDLPFLMITGRADIDSVVEAKSCGVTGYITKPFSPQQLEAKLRIILHRMAQSA